MRVQGRVLVGLVRARCVVVQRVRLARDRVVKRGCRSEVMCGTEEKGGFFSESNLLCSCVREVPSFLASALRYLSPIYDIFDPSSYH